MTIEPGLDKYGHKSEVRDVNGLHYHTCSNRKCNTTWSHPDECAGIDEMHECPKCGKDQHWKTELKEVETVEFPWTGSDKCKEEIAKEDERDKKAAISLIDDLLAGGRRADKAIVKLLFDDFGFDDDEDDDI